LEEGFNMAVGGGRVDGCERGAAAGLSRGVWRARGLRGAVWRQGCAAALQALARRAVLAVTSACCARWRCIPSRCRHAAPPPCGCTPGPSRSPHAWSATRPRCPRTHHPVPLLTPSPSLPPAPLRSRRRRRTWCSAI
jgi:hypothetical protein